MALATWDFTGKGGTGWGGPPADPPIETPDIPPLWGDLPDPPTINQQPPAGGPNVVVMPSPLPGGKMAGLYMEFPQRSTVTEREGGLAHSTQQPQMPQIKPNDRHPVTGAPIVNPDLPPDNPLPPGQKSIEPTDQHPITGAPNRPAVPPHGVSVPVIRPDGTVVNEPDQRTATENMQAAGEAVTLGGGEGSHTQPQPQQAQAQPQQAAAPAPQRTPPPPRATRSNHRRPRG